MPASKSNAIYCMKYLSNINMSNVDTLEDVFDEEADIDIVNRREWGKISNDLKKGGYRDGLAAGQEHTVQRGFNTGYRRAVDVGQSLGHLRGKLSAYLSWSSLKNSDSESADKDNNVEIETLLKTISQFEQDLLVLVAHEEAVAERNVTETVGHDSQSSDQGQRDTTTQGQRDTTTHSLCTADSAESCGDSGGQTEAIPATLSKTISPSEKLFKETFENVIIEAQAKCDQFAIDVQKLLNLKCEKQ